MGSRNSLTYGQGPYDLCPVFPPTVLLHSAHTPGRGPAGGTSDVLWGLFGLSIAGFSFSICNGRKAPSLHGLCCLLSTGPMQGRTAPSSWGGPSGSMKGPPRAPPKPSLSVQDRDLLFCNLPAPCLLNCGVPGNRPCPSSECARFSQTSSQDERVWVFVQGS